MIRIAGIDTGKQNDSFFLTGIKVDDGKMYVVGAKRWLGKAYLDVEADIGKLHLNNPFDHYAVERNNAGDHVIEILQKQYRMPVIPIWTSGPLKDNKKVYSPRYMDKNEQVRWLLIQKQSGNLIFPKNPTKDIMELKRQMSIFAEIRPKGNSTGTVKFMAEGSEHDDGVLSLLLASRIARFYMEKGKKSGYGSASRNYNPLRPEEDLLGSGVPNQYKVIDKQVHMP